MRERVWKNEAGYTLVLVITKRGSRVTLYKPNFVTGLNFSFEYWEDARAERAAETLAEYGHMQEVPVGLLLREGDRGQGEAGLVQQPQ